MPKLTDKDEMPFGKHQGEALANVPASYLIWCYETFKTMRPDLKEYIEDNLTALQAEVKRSGRERSR